MTAAETSGSLVGFELEGRYRVLREVGRGGMGVVYEAEHIELGKHVAIKVMLDKYANDVDAVARFRREALAASRIGNPHIIDVSHIGVSTDGKPFVVMELLDGVPLSSILEHVGPMQAPRAIHIMRQVLRAVGAAHGKGIIHRDLKPDNIFLVRHDDQPDFVKLLDFGISKITDANEIVAVTRLTTTGMVMGTPLYMAPEQATGSTVDHRADVYACGAVLFEMLAGHPPFNETNYNVLVAKLLTAPPPNLAELRAGLPPQLVAAVHRALEKEPADRFASAEEFAKALPTERAASQLETELATTVPPAAATSAWTTVPARAKRWIWIAAIGGGAIASTVVAFGLRHGADAPAIAPVPTTGSASIPRPPPVELGKLEVKTIPAGADVRVDTNDAGASPIEISVTPGRHRVHVVLAGYRTVDEDQDIHGSERTSVVVTLQPADKPGPTKSMVMKSRIVPHDAIVAHDPVVTPARSPRTPPDAAPADPIVPSQTAPTAPIPSGAKPNPF